MATYETKLSQLAGAVFGVILGTQLFPTLHENLENFVKDSLNGLSPIDTYGTYQARAAHNSYELAAQIVQRKMPDLRSDDVKSLATDMIHAFMRDEGAVLCQRENQISTCRIAFNKVDEVDAIAAYTRALLIDSAGGPISPSQVPGLRRAMGLS